MQNLSNTPIPQWKIKYDSQFNVSPQQNTGGSNTPPENGGGKFPWTALFISMIIVAGLYYNSQKNEQDKYTT
jgi:hypothetical protein